MPEPPYSQSAGTQQWPERCGWAEGGECHIALGGASYLIDPGDRQEPLSLGGLAGVRPEAVRAEGAAAEAADLPQRPTAYAGATVQPERRRTGASAGITAMA
jgi:hypothetical protein